MRHRGDATPDDRGEILRRAEKYRLQGRIRKAIREYETILSMDPRNTDVHIRIAPLYIRAGRKVQAKASLRQAVAWYEAQGFVDKAVASLRLALSVDRRDLVAYLHLADLYLGKGHVGDAMKLLHAARRIFRGRKFLKEALAVEEKILSLVPEDFPAQVSRVRLLWKAGNKREALERLGHMEAEWARKGNQRNWRRTRRFLFRLSPSLATGWGCFLSLFTAPAPYRPAKRKA